MKEKEKIRKKIRDLLPHGKWKIYEAMNYTPLAGGKHLRAMIILRGAEDLGISEEIATDVAAAVELFHSGTLIHDDMPEIDNASTRRGKPALHKVYGEGIALLAGDGLFFLSFKIMSKYPKLFKEFAEAAYDVLIGESMDVELEELENFTENDIYEMYEKKTGALFGFAFSAPAILADNRNWETLKKMGRRFGLAFQTFDDIKDVIGDSKLMGKDTGLDVRKKTLVKILGLEKAQHMAEKIYEEVLEELRRMEMKNVLRFLEEVKELVRKG